VKISNSIQESKEHNKERRPSKFV